MEWISHEAPPETGRYLVSIKLQRSPSGAIEVSNYVAHYESHEGKWYKYDPFIDKYRPTVEVEGEVTAWAKDVGVFLK